MTDAQRNSASSRLHPALSCAWGVAIGLVLGSIVITAYVRLAHGIKLSIFLPLRHGGAAEIALYSAFRVLGLVCVAHTLAQKRTITFVGIGAGLCVFGVVGAVTGYTAEGPFEWGRLLAFHLAPYGYAGLALAGGTFAVLVFRGGLLGPFSEEDQFKYFKWGFALQVTTYLASRVLLATSEWAVSRPFPYLLGMTILAGILPLIAYTASIMSYIVGVGDGESRTRRESIIRGVLCLFCVFVVLVF